MQILELKNVNKSYKLNGSTTKILNNINLKFSQGEFVSILGESGCGKSTLMNIIGGMDSDFSGDVLINQNSLTEMKESDLDDYRKTKIGFVFQNFNLISHLSVLDNVTLAMEMMDLSNEERIHRGIELLTEVGLEKHIHKKPNQLSGGQKQRVAIARALANDAEIILADEPTGALDKNTTVQILELLNSIAQKGKLIIAVTHSKNVADFGTRVISIEDGAIISDNKRKESLYDKTKETKCIDVKNATDEELEELYGDLYSIQTKDLNILACIKLALRNMKLNLKRNTLVSFGSAIGICSLILMLSIGAGVKDYIMSEITATSNPKVIEISKPSETTSMTPIPEVTPFEKIDIEKITAIPKVEKVEPVVTKNMVTKITTMEKDKESDTSTDLFLLSTVGSSITDENIIAGRLPKKDEIVLSSLAIKSLFNTEDYFSVLGKTVSVTISELNARNKPVLVEKEMSLIGVYDMNTPLMQVPLGIVDYNGLANVYEEHKLTLKPSQIDVYTTSEEHIDVVKEQLVDMGYDSSQTAQMIEQLNNMLDIITALFVGISGISLIVSGVMILVVLYISVIERTKEIGILRAIGARKKDIKHIFIVESALLGLMGGIIAIITSLIVSNIGNSILSDKFGTAIINLDYKYILIGLAVSIIVSIIAGFIPSNRASKLDPVESLRYE